MRNCGVLGAEGMRETACISLSIVLLQFFPQRSMPSRYCEFASGDDQAIPYAVGMYKDHDGKCVPFSILVIPRHAIFSQN